MKYKLIISIFLLLSVLGNKAYTQETSKVFIKSIENKIEVGTMVKNRNLVFGFKNILLEALQESGYDVTDSINSSDYSIKVELLFFDVEDNSVGVSLFHKSESETVLKIKGYLYNKEGKKIKDCVSVGTSSGAGIWLSTLLGGGAKTETNDKDPKDGKAKTEQADPVAPVVINLQNNNTNQQKQGGGTNTIIKEKTIIEKQAPAEKAADKPTNKSQTEDSPW
jgi:hypothetical protein